MDIGNEHHVQVIPGSHSNLVVIENPCFRIRRSIHRRYVLRIERLTRIGFSFYARSMDLCWVEHNGNLYGLEKWQRYPHQPVNFHKLWVFNFAAKRWKLKYLVNHDTMDRLCLAANFMFVVGDQLVCNVNGETIYHCTLSKDTEYRLNKVSASGGDEHLVTSLQKAATIRIDSFIYAVGGWREQDGFELFTDHADVHRLSIRTLRWECLFDSSSLDLGFLGHALAHDDTRIYVLGGRNTRSGSDLSLVQLNAFDLNMCAWVRGRQCKPDPKHGYPTARRGLSASQHVNNSGDYEVYILGGVSSVYQCYDLWKVNLSTGQWTCLYVKLRNHYYTCVAFDNVSLCVIGSSLIDTQLGTVLQMWMGIPTLLSMCWDMITAMNPRLNTCDRKRLIAEGIPRHCLSRLSPAESSDMIYTY